MSTLIEEDVDTKKRSDSLYSHQVILFNDDVNSFDHVERCLVSICFKSKKEAKNLAMEVHKKGKAPCYKGSLEACETIAEKLKSEGLTVTVE